QTLTSASGRALHLSWSTPPGASGAHVASVATDPAVTGDPATVSTWTYGYTGDALGSVCPPATPTLCTMYGHSTGSLYSTATRNSGPHSYWRLAETSGTVAASSVIENMGGDNGTYSAVTLGQPGPLSGSGATAAGLNGTSSSVALPADLVTAAANQSVSVWFTTGGVSGVVLGQSWDAPASVSTTTGAYAPVLYVGTDGKLRGQFPAAAPAAALGTLVGWGSGRCLTVEGNSSANGARIIIYDCATASNFLWSYTAAKELRVTTGGVVKCLDAAGSGTGDGTDIQSYACNGSMAQKWTLRSDGRIVGDQSGRCLDVEGAATANSARLQLWACGPGWRA
ncbi:MAG: RICIN domain-containing protein, partial [Sporichthyaceae bacterium]|nr:RICIN domain-containing protein [Sporichthyaceae bacterium]